MRNTFMIIFFFALLSSSAPRAQGTWQDELPDDYIPFALHQLDDGLEGESEFLEGFTISMDVPRERFEGGLSVDAIFSLVRRQNVTGTLTYPNGKTTTIEYEIVHYRETEDIYMKSSLGYFLWEYMSVQGDTLSFAIYWWYCPPATELDIEIIEMAEGLLADSTHWHKDDDRDCADDIEGNRWSLFCALKHSSIVKAGEYNHHNTAMQTTRFVIDELIPGHGFAHTLMDYNNAPSTRHGDILHVLEWSKKRIRRELLHSSAVDTLKSRIPMIMERDSIPGVSVAVVSDRKILWMASYGFTDKARKKQVTNETPFSIQSMSKNFTALAVLMAVQDGLLDLDAPIARYLPGFTVHSPHEDHPEDKITLRHLLSHRAGFTHEAPVGGNFDNRPHTFEEHIESISDTWLRYPVGYRFAYSNLGLDLAGYILQQQSGVSFERYLENEVLLPLGMKTSTFDMSRIKENESRAIGHVAGADTLPVYIPMIPAGGLYTNACEMANYLRFHIDKGVFEGRRLIKRDIFDEMCSVAFPLLSQECGYCFGLWKQMMGNTYQYYHGGAGYGFVSGMIIYPELKLGVVVLTNSEGHGLSVFSVRMMIEPIIRSLYGQEQPVPISIDERDLELLPIDHPGIQHILGRYGHGENSRTFEVRDDVLGVSIGDEFYPARVFTRGGELVGKFGNYTEFMFLPDVGGKPGTLVIKNRWLDSCHFFDYNDGPNDRPGPAKPEWNEYLGQYQMFYFGRPMGPFTVSIKNGYLYFDDQRCLEYEPGLFFVYDGEALDFRAETVTGSNIKLYKRQ